MEIDFTLLYTLFFIDRNFIYIHTHTYIISCTLKFKNKKRIKKVLGFRVYTHKHTYTHTHTYIINSFYLYDKSLIKKSFKFKNLSKIN